MKYKLLALLLVFTNHVFAQHNTYFPDPNPQINNRIQEWQNLKFGLLMHWGPYSQWGIVESWSICPEDLSWATGGRKKDAPSDYNNYVKAYEQLQTTFNPTQFDPEKWAAAAKNAGMKYMVFTTKHHDGFCMFDSKFTNYKITDKATPFSVNKKNNVTKEIFNAFRANDFWIGAYFSKPDWHSNYYWWNKFPPSDRNCNYSIEKYPTQWNQFVDYTHNQINELLSDYGKVDILWLDGGWVRKTTDDEVKNYLLEKYEGSRWARNPQNQDIKMDSLVTTARQKQPNLIVVDRAVTGIHQNYLTPEQHIPETGLPYPWETCMTMATSWSFVPNDVYKPTNEIIEKLVNIVSKGGNYLLNIAPSPQGTFSDTAYLRLQEIGIWMKKNGYAIYNTKMYTKTEQDKNISITQSLNEKTKYIFLNNFTTQPIEIEKINFLPNTKLSILSTGEKLKWKKVNNKIVIQLTSKMEKSNEHVWVLKVE
jgi:alpha-L-fucosidase